MKILAIESSGTVASTAIYEDDIIKSEFTINNRLTHSETLLPMIREMEKISGVKLSDCDAVAVSKGPGSFTGLRIGAASAKGLCLAWNKPVIRVSSLMAMAYNVIDGVRDTVICPIMDARRGQIYGAAYDEKLSAIIPDGAYDLNEFLVLLKEKANEAKESFIFLGDGVPVHKDTIKGELLEKAVFAAPHVSLQHASSVAMLGSILYSKYLSGDETVISEKTVVDSDDFVPDYFRKTQAEREMSEGILEDPGLHSLKKIGRGK